MKKYYVLVNSDTGLYYSDYKVFIEPNKKFAKKMKIGQAKSIAQNNNRYKNSNCILLETAD